ncbi:Lovastatin diketide synthase LovF [Cytospora mali]|uniref:Lovastatin diketide synthase LovF n=1 Tax=Cytospora mali TaxID=578113 RepID=A0A194V0Z1_CYTMA|nr:Lovastatin diketide synthase LovF [Valsa mali var. pyri (nom. inval.)]
MVQPMDPPMDPQPDAVLPIAIIGMACRFPGDGENVESLLEMLKNGENAWSEFPADRVNIDGFYHPSGNRQGSIGFRGAHFLKDDIKAFDAQFFNISQTEAQAIDPQQRILLEVTYQALENDYEQVVLRDADWAPQYAATGTGAAILSNRISYQFNLRGPSQTVDTGCSASLVGVHNGCQDLRIGRSNLAVAAGVGMILTPATMMPMTALNFLGKNGKCFTFTNKAEGYGRGEGVGVVVLKRLDDAIRDNDTIRAVIRGSRVNQDGRTPGITMPSTAAQLSNIKAVYKEAGLEVDQTAYVECHGTGTPAGDPKESFAVSQAFCENRDADKPILIGSIKPNIGHLEGAAGVAGLIKAVLAVERGQITKNLYFDPSIGNPDIRFDEWKVKVPTSLTPWPMDGLRRASVNCFGFGGTNAHIILDDAGTYLAQRSLAANHRSVATTGVSLASTTKQKTFPTTQLILISSHERDGVARIASGHAPFITANSSDPHVLANYAYTMSRRSSLEFKAVIVAHSASDLAAKLAQPETLGVHRFLPSADNPVPKLAMVFCGQGAQWHAMGRELTAFEPFSNSLVGASKYLSKIVGSDFDLLQELRHDDPALSRINEPKFAQPATTAIQVALVDLLKASQICPLAVVGHSSGEIAAAYAAGFITREDAWLIAFRRGEHAHSLQYLYPSVKGRMMAVGLSAVQVQHYICRVRAGSVVVACENSPVSVTISGDEDQILEMAQMMASDGVFHKLLAVTTAYHSHHMRLVEDAYRQSLDGVKAITNAQGPQMLSSVTGENITASEVGPEYWAKNLTSPVLFNQAFSAMYKAIKPEFVVEISPAVTLNRPVQEIMKIIAPKKAAKGLPCLPLLKRDTHACTTALEALGEIWARGHPADFSWVWRSKEGLLPQLLVDLPPYPFNHSKVYWFESHLGVALRLRKHGREDLIGAPLAESSPQDPRWRGFFRLEENPWLSDHQVQKTFIYPAAGLLTMALEAARQCSDPHLLVDNYQICNFNIAKPVIIPAGQHGLEHVLNAKLLKIPSPDTTHGMAVYSFSLMTKTEHGPWQENADGQFKILYRGKVSDEPIEHNIYLRQDCQDTYLQLRGDCTQTINPRSFYEKLDGIGMNYGPLFQNIVALAHNQNSCTSVVRIPDTKSKMPAQFEYDHLIHPATLDAMFQTVFAVGDESMVPSCIRQISFSPAMLRGAGAEFHGYATAQRRGFREAIADIVMSDETFSKPMVVVKGMEFIKLASSGESGYLPSNRQLCSEIVWKELQSIWPGIDDSFTVNDGAPTILLLPDGNLTEMMSHLAQCFALPNVEPVRLSQLNLQHASQFCISLVEIDQALLFNMSPRAFDTIKLLLKATPGLLWVTAGAQQTAEMPVMAPFHGLARTIRSEDSSKRIITLDFGAIQNLADVKVSALGIQNVFNKSFVKPDLLEVQEVEYSLRDGKLFGARLYPLQAINDIIEKGQDHVVHIDTLSLEEVKEPLKLAVGKIGDIDSTYFESCAAEKQHLGSNEVRIAIESTNLYQLDLETIMGRSSEGQLGVDVIGTVSETGASVTDLPVGSLVVALAKDTFRTSVTVDRVFVHQLHNRTIIRGLSPSALVAAYHRLNNIGGLSSGDTVFIHCAVGPFGDAAIRVAKMLGATIFAGASASAHYSVLHEYYGLPMEQIIDMTNDSFPDQIMHLTAGNGVDYVFSPTPDHLEQSAQCVADNGHIFLLSNATMSKAVITPRHANVSIHKFDLFDIAKKRPRVIAKAWAEVLQLVLSGQLSQPSPCLVREERVEYLDQLWKSMAIEPGRHLNTVTFTDNSLVRVGKNPLSPAALDPNGTYVLVGGLGGLGKAVAGLMAGRGARNLLFLSRSGAKTPEDLAFLQSLAERGVNALALAVDICDENGLRQSLAHANMPTIKGAVQCAAVIADAVWETMSYEDWMAATRPKMLGSMNLHNVLPGNMDFFVFLSSASGVIGNRGQGNYAAGNCFQDALARHRTSLGMKNSVSIDLGPVMGAGMLENDEKTLAILKASGFFMVMLDNFLFLVERAMVGGGGDFLHLPAQIVTGVGTGGLILQNQVSDPYWTETKMFEVLNQLDLPSLPTDNSPSATPSQQPMSTAISSQGSGKALLMALKSADSPDEAAETVLAGCIEYLSTSLGMAPEDMDADKSLTAYGVDSLVTSSFRSWIFKNVGVKVNDMEVIGAASIMELARGIAEKGGYGGHNV